MNINSHQFSGFVATNPTSYHREESTGRIRTCVVGSKARHDWPLHHGTGGMNARGKEALAAWQEAGAEVESARRAMLPYRALYASNSSGNIISSLILSILA